MRSIVFFILTISNFAIAQSTDKIDLLSKIADEICLEIKNNKSSITNESMLGLIMMKVVNQHKQDVIVYYGEDYITNTKTIDELGVDIGSYMGLKCPEVFLDYIEETDYDTLDLMKIQGQFSKINKGQFLTFVVKEVSGKTHTFILLNHFDNAYLLIDKIIKIKDSVEVTYFVSEIYDATIGKFVNYNVVTDIQIK